VLQATNKKMKLIKLLIISLISFQSFGQSVIGYYKHIESPRKAGGLSFTTRLNLKTDSTFQYVFTGDLFFDYAEGTYKVRKNKIFLKYTFTLDNYITSIDSTTIKLNTQPETSYTKIDTVKTRIMNISYSLRPTIIEWKNKKLKIQKTMDNEEKVTKKTLQKESIIEWNTYIQDNARIQRVINQ